MTCGEHSASGNHVITMLPGSKQKGLASGIACAPANHHAPFARKVKDLQECGQVHQGNQEKTRRELDLQAGDLGVHVTSPSFW